MSTLNFENAVADRYSKAAEEREPALCCPVQYNQNLLKAIPDEIIERDYGCGDPSPFVKPGDTVLDLGSGGGKLCYIAAQVVGAEGKVIGIDCNQEMLALARKYQEQVGETIGYANVEFRCGIIQNLALDLELYQREIQSIEATGVNNILDRRRLEQRLSQEQPMIANDSVDCVVSNCVLNLVQPQDRTQLFSELYRVVKQGGRVAISDIVSDEDVPEHMKNNPELWSGCISGAWREDEFLAEFERAGFYGMHFAKRESRPWQTVEGIEFRSVTVLAYKGNDGPCLERNQAVIYRGPFQTIKDDDGHLYIRGQRTAVCDKTFQQLQKEPYRESFLPVEPYGTIPVADAQEFDRKRRTRHPRESKGLDYDLTQCKPDNDACC